MDRLEKQVEEGEDFTTITLWPVNSPAEFSRGSISSLSVGNCPNNFGQDCSYYHIIRAELKVPVKEN